MKYFSISTSKVLLFCFSHLTYDTSGNYFYVWFEVKYCCFLFSPHDYPVVLASLGPCLSRTKGSLMLWSISGFSNLFHFLTYLSVYQYNNYCSFITLEIQCASPPILLIPFEIILSILGPMHINFIICLSCSTRKFAEFFNWHFV